MQIDVVISAVVSSEAKAYFQDKDGKMHSFFKDAMDNEDDFDKLKEGSKVSLSFEENGRISHVVLKEDPFDEDAPLYIEPDGFPLLEEPPLKDHLLIDYGKYVLAKGDRNEERAKLRLIELCRDLGANSIINFKLQEERRNVMGFGFIYYYATGIPAVVADKSDKGEVSLKFLQHRLNKQKISKLGNMYANIRIGKIVINVIAVILFIIFAIGFIFSR